MSAVIKRQSEVNPNQVNFKKNINPLLKRLFISRELYDDEEIDLSINSLLEPTKMKGIDEAVSELIAALKKGSRILIVGDFDVDGATSCALAIRSLKAMGHDNIQFIVPNRFEYGYGLTPEIVEIAAKQNPDLIITVDNGIASIDGVKAARELGIRVIITDHHLPGKELPEANAILNPNQKGCNFPSKSLAGVGVVFYLMLALRSSLRKIGWFSDELEEPNMAKFLDLVALGTIADVVPLDKNNRILVEQGIRRIRIGDCCVGIKALIELSKRSSINLVSSDIGFAIAPRLNAAGRLDDISIGIGCLLTDDIDLARGLANELDTINLERRQIEDDMKKQAEKILQELEKNASSDLPTGICLFDPSWHQGVVGILASRIKEKYHRPVICFALANDAEDCDELKGSARSIKGLHIRDALDQIATKNEGLVKKFGGHSMAAGLSLKLGSFDKFAKAFDSVVKEVLNEDDLKHLIYSDGELRQDELNITNAKLIKFAMPWGQGFPEPIFNNEFTIINQNIIKEKHIKLKLSLSTDKNTTYDAIAFNIDPTQWIDIENRNVNLVYSIDVNSFRGNESLQLIVRHIEKNNFN